MDIPFLLELVLCLFSLACAVASAWFARKHNVRELENTVDELSVWAEKALRSARATRMREVRAAAAENDPPPQLAAGKNSTTPMAPVDRKSELRRRAGMLNH